MHPVKYPQLLEVKQDWEVYLGLPFFTMSCITWCCWRWRNFMLFAHNQTGPDKHESCWRQARSGRSFAPCPDLTSSLGGNGAPDNPLLSPLGYRTRGTFLLQEYGLLAAVTPVEMDDAVMKRLFWDECCHSSQVEFWEGRYTRLCSWGKCMSRRRAALVRRRGELQATSFAVRECRYKPSHLNTPEEIDEGWRHR